MLHSSAWPLLNIAQTEDFVPTTNALAANPVILNTNNPAGTTFHFQSCTSSSLGFGPHNTGDDYECDAAGCERDYYNYIRIINPTSGNCLTTKPAANGYTELYFTKCNANPTTTSQIFQAFQAVELGYNFQGIRRYYSSYLSPFGYEAYYNSYEAQSAWVVGDNTKTILYNPPSIGETGDSLTAVILTQS